MRVLDFGLLTAGANTSAMLADLGADVLKIELGAYLDPFRVVGKLDNARRLVEPLAAVPLHQPQQARAGAEPQGSPKAST